MNMCYFRVVNQRPSVQKLLFAIKLISFALNAISSTLYQLDCSIILPKALSTVLRKSDDSNTYALNALTD